MATELTVDELAEADGLDLGTSHWVEVTQERIDLFAEATGDRQWIHVDPDAAADGPFGGTIAHGYLTVSLLPALLYDMVTVTDAGMGVNYGIDKLRLTAPVPSGSKVRLHATIDHAERRAGAVRYYLDVEVEVEGGDKPALVGTVVYLVYPAS